MFVESAKYELFAVEFKKSFNELINGLKQIWYDYDFKAGAGNPYYYPEFSDEEIKKDEEELDTNIQNLICNLSSKFELGQYSSFIKDFFTYYSDTYKDNRWFDNVIDYSANGKIEPPVDMYSSVGAHQGNLSFVIGEYDSTDLDEIQAELLRKYQHCLDKQADPIIASVYDELVMFWEQVILINMFDENNPKFYDVKLIVREF